MATTEGLVRKLLAEHANLDTGDISVDALGSRVTLRGRVRTQRERDEAEATVRQISGVGEVWNDLVVTGEPI